MKEGAFLKMSKALRRDFGFAFAGQASVVVVGVLRTLLIPMMLGANLHAYAYWQAYLLYLGYMSVGFWGFNDGFYVRHLKRDDSSTRTRLSSALLVDTLFLLGEAVVLIALAMSTDIFGDSTVIFVAVFANLPLTGLYGALTYHLQLTGKIDKASVIVTLEKLLFLLAVIAAYVTGTLSLYSLIVIEIGSKLLMVMYGYLSERNALLSGPLNWGTGVAEFRENISVGVKLMLGAYFALLLTGVVRMFVQVTAATAEFAYYALAFSFTSIIFQLGQGITVVLYPHLSRSAHGSMGEHFQKMDRTLTLLFPIVLLGYFPSAILIRSLLPRYEVSGYYLAFLLPVVGFQLIVGTLNGTYYKLLRQERNMMRDNLLSLLALIALCLVLREHIVAMTLAQILVLAFRAWDTQRQFRVRLRLPKGYAVLGQLVWTGAFLATVQIRNVWLMAVFVAAVLVYLARRRTEIQAIYGRYLKGDLRALPEGS